MDLDALIKSIDIVDYISQYVDLEQRGDEFWGLSPFSQEKTPSFSVRRETRSFYCFSSGVGGNVLTFTKFYKKCSARQAVEFLKEFAGYDGKLTQPRGKMDATVVCKKFSKPASSRSRGTGVVLPDNCMDKYEKRREKLSVWEAEGISRESLDKFQVYYDSFSNRLVYPIRDISGRIVNVGGRTLDPQWKEKGLRKYTYFYHWGELATIYGLFDNLSDILRQREIILFEGCKSVLLADTWQVRNCGAILTSHLNPNQMKILAKLGCRVVFALDKDVRVRDDHNIAKLKNYVNVEYIWDFNDLLGEKDAPVDKGEEIFRRLYVNRVRWR